jgi:hypothetical protein
VSIENQPLTENQVLFLRAYLDAGDRGGPLSLPHLFKRLANYTAFEPAGLPARWGSSSVDRGNHGYAEAFQQRTQELTQLREAFERWAAEDPQLELIGVFQRLADQLEIVMTEGERWCMQKLREHELVDKDAHYTKPQDHWMWKLLTQNGLLRDKLQMVLRYPRQQTEKTLRAEADYWRKRAEEAERRAATTEKKPEQKTSTGDPELDEIFADFNLSPDERQEAAALYKAALAREEFDTAAIERAVTLLRKKCEQRGDTPEQIEQSVKRLRVNLLAINARLAARRKMV